MCRFLASPLELALQEAQQPWRQKRGTARRLIDRIPHPVMWRAGYYHGTHKEQRAVLRFCALLSATITNMLRSDMKA